MGGGRFQRSEATSSLEYFYLGRGFDFGASTGVRRRMRRQTSAWNSGARGGETVQHRSNLRNAVRVLMG